MKANESLKKGDASIAEPIKHQEKQERGKSQTPGLAYGRISPESSSGVTREVWGRYL
jgi:hypothetical protein